MLAMKADRSCSLSSASLSMVINACMGSPREWKSLLKQKPLIQRENPLLAAQGVGTFGTHKRRGQDGEMAKDSPHSRAGAGSLQLPCKVCSSTIQGLSDQPHYKIRMRGLKSQTRHLIVLQPWERDLTSLSLCFWSSRMVMVTLPCRVSVRAGDTAANTAEPHHLCSTAKGRPSPQGTSVLLTCEPCIRTRSDYSAST